MHQVRRGVEARLEARRAQRRLGERARRALPVRPRDVQHGHGEMRIRQQRQRLAHPVESELHAEVAANEENALELLECHRSTGSDLAARMLRAEAAEAASRSSPNTAR